MEKADLGRLLANARTAAKLSQRTLADRLGIAQSTVSSYELGVNEVPVATIYTWAQACGKTAKIELVFSDHEDPIAPLVEVARLLSADDLALLIRIARALPELDLTLRTAHTEAMEKLAVLSPRKP